MTCAAVPSVLQNGVVVYQNVKNAHELEWIPAAAPVTAGTPAEKIYTAVMLQRDPQTQRLYLHDAITEKELDIRGTEHLKTHRGSDTTNSELYTADILRNALNVKSEQLSTGRSIDEMTGEHLSNVGHMKEEAFPKIKGSYAENGNGPRGNASTKNISASGENVNTNRAAARKG